MGLFQGATGGRGWSRNRKVPKLVCKGQADFLEELTSLWHLEARRMVFSRYPQLLGPCLVAISLQVILSARSVVSLSFLERRVAGSVPVSPVEERKYWSSSPRSLLSPSVHFQPLCAWMTFNSFWRCNGLARLLPGYLSLTTSAIKCFSRPREGSQFSQYSWQP